MPDLLCGTRQQISLSSADLQVEDPLYSALITNIVINGCLCYTTIMMNIMTIHALRKTSSLPKPSKTLLLSLAVSDLGIGILGTRGQPLYIALLVEELRCNLNKTLTGFAHVFLNVPCISSFCIITALCADRYLAIQRRLRYQEVVTHVNA